MSCWNVRYLIYLTKSSNYMTKASSSDAQGPPLLWEEYYKSPFSIDFTGMILIYSQNSYLLSHLTLRSASEPFCTKNSLKQYGAMAHRDVEKQVVRAIKSDENVSAMITERNGSEEGGNAKEQNRY